MNQRHRNPQPNIALISIHTAPSPQAVPLANAFLKSASTNSRVNIILTDFFIGQQPEECAQVISGTHPIAVGFSMYSWNRILCSKIAECLRIRLPMIKIFAGGPEVTADPESILATGNFDFIITGEGEIPFTALCNRIADQKDMDGIPGLATQSNTVILPDNRSLKCLDSIPSPFLSGVLDTRSYSGILWQLSRGCSFSCDFCFDSRGQKSVKRFSIERLEAELKHFASTGVTQIFVLDSTFNQDVKRAKTILRMIRKIAPKIHFHFEVRSEFIDREMAVLFSQIICSLQIGLQSSDPAVLKQVGRSFAKDDFKSRIDLLNESGAVFGFDLMYGLPGDNLQGFCESLDFAISLYPNHLDIFPLAVLPGTALRARSSTLGLTHLSEPPYTLISSPTYSITEMHRAQQIASACDIFYTRGKAVAWFNGVTDLLGLKPSDFFQRFADMLVIRSGSDFNESAFSDMDVRNLQREFLIGLFSTKSLRRFQPLVLDLADYHYYYAAALLAPQTTAKKRHYDRRNVLQLKLQKSDSLQLAKFHYEILDIIESGAPDIRWMYANLEPLGSYAAIYPSGNIICTQSFEHSYFCLLESMNGQTCAGELSSRLDIPLEAANEFILFALKEGILVL